MAAEPKSLEPGGAAASNEAGSGGGCWTGRVVYDYQLKKLVFVG
jgi:hypothetical protein